MSELVHQLNAAVDQLHMTVQDNAAFQLIPTQQIWIIQKWLNTLTTSPGSLEENIQDWLADPSRITDTMKMQLTDALTKIITVKDILEDNLHTFLNPPPPPHTTGSRRRRVRRARSSRRRTRTSSH